MLQFTDDYKTGIPQIDKEHAYLVQLLNESTNLLKSENTDIHELANYLIDRLKNYAVVHFTHEEEYMGQINDPELPRQIKEHAAFLSKINDFTIDCSLKVRDLEELLQYMAHWLFDHILASDIMIGKIKPATQNAPFAFTKKYETGIDLIDQEHKTLFSIIREANDLVHAELLHDKFDKTVEILDHLKTYTESHFQHEEEYMEKIQYPELEAQKTAHTAFIEKLVNISIWDLDAIDENQQQYLEELIDYLLEWLSNHILKADRQIGEWEKNKTED